MNAGTKVTRCPGCGKVLPDDAPAGLCPRCLVARHLLESAAHPDDGTREADRQPSPPEEIARHFPQFEVLECLGRGGMAMVYKARQPRLDRLVALKVLAPGRAKDPQFAERFQREAQALARLNHPSIVTVHEFGETNGLYYLVMEYVDGASLRDVLRQGRVPPALALSLVPRICEALQYAHDEGVVHRDIKPENILLDRQGRVKIADFGIAKLCGNPGATPPLTEARAVVGTPHYMAPEQVEHPQSVDHRADIYSLGVVFYELLTGELPLGRFSPPSSRAGTDQRLDPIVLRTLEKEPAQRYQRAGEVRTDVESVAASSEPPPDPARRLTSSSPTDSGTTDLPNGVAGDATSSLRLLSFGVGSVGVLNLAAMLLALLFAVVLVRCDRLGIDLDGPLPELAQWLQDPTPSSLRAALGVAGFVMLAGAGLTVLGALRLRQLQSYRMALMACVLAFILPPALLLGLPVGIWGLVLLGRRTAQAQFAAAHQAQLANRHPQGCGPEQRPRFKGGNLRPATGVILLALALIVLTSQWLSSGDPTKVTRREQLAAEESRSRKEALAIAAAHARTQLQATTAHTLESSPPMVVYTVPTAGDTHVPPTLTELRVAFSKPMKDRHWTWAAWKPGSLPEITGQPRFLEDGQTCVLPVRLAPGRAYGIWLNSDQAHGFRDIDDQPSVPYLLTFQVAPTGETSP
jgi:serine/threonine protein kinase